MLVRGTERRSLVLAADKRWQVLHLPIELCDAAVVVDPLDNQQILILGGNPATRICYTFDIETQEYWSLSKYPSFSQGANVELSDGTINPANTHAHTLASATRTTQTVVAVQIPKILADYWTRKGEKLLSDAKEARKRANETKEDDVDPQMEHLLNQMNQLRLALGHDSDSDDDGANNDRKNDDTNSVTKDGLEYDSDLELGYYSNKINYNNANGNSNSNDNYTINKFNNNINNNNNNNGGGNREVRSLSVATPLDSVLSIPSSPKKNRSKIKMNLNLNVDSNGSRNDNEMVTRILSLNGSGYCFYYFDLKLNEWKILPQSIDFKYYPFRTFISHGTGSRAISTHTKNGDYLCITGGNYRPVPSQIYTNYKQRLKDHMNDKKRQFNEIKTKLVQMEQQWRKRKQEEEKYAEKKESNENSNTNNNKFDSFFDEKSNVRKAKPNVMKTVSKQEKRKQKFDVYLQRNRFSPRVRADNNDDNEDEALLNPFDNPFAQQQQIQVIQRLPAPNIMNNINDINNMNNMNNININNEEEETTTATTTPSTSETDRTISDTETETNSDSTTSLDEIRVRPTRARTRARARRGRVRRAPRRRLPRRLRNRNNVNREELFARLRRQSSANEEETMYLTKQEKKFLQREMKLYFYIDSNHPSYKKLNDIHLKLETVLSKREYNNMFGKYHNGNFNMNANNSNSNNNINDSIDGTSSEAIGQLANNMSMSVNNNRGVSPYNEFLGTKWPRFNGNYRQERTFSIYNLRNFTEIMNFDLPQLKRYHGLVEIINPSETVLKKFNDFKESKSLAQDKKKEPTITRRKKLPRRGRKRLNKRRPSIDDLVTPLGSLPDTPLVDDIEHEDEDEAIRRAIAASLADMKVDDEKKEKEKETEKDNEQEKEKEKEKEIKIDNDINIDEKDEESGIVGVFGNQAKVKNKDKDKDKGKDTDNDEEVKIDKKMIDSWEFINKTFKEKSINTSRNVYPNVKYFLLFGGTSRGSTSLLYRINLESLHWEQKSISHSRDANKGNIQNVILKEFGYVMIDDLYVLIFGSFRGYSYQRRIFCLNIQTLTMNDLSANQIWRNENTNTGFINKIYSKLFLNDKIAPFKNEIIENIQRWRKIVQLPEPTGRCSAVYTRRLRKRENMGSKWNVIYTGNPMIDYIEEIHIIGGKHLYDASDTKPESDIHWIIQLVDLLPFSMLQELWINRGYSDLQFKDMITQMIEFEVNAFVDMKLEKMNRQKEKKINNVKSTKDGKLNGVDSGSGVQYYANYAISWIMSLNPWR